MTSGIRERLAVGAKNAAALSARLEGTREPICGVVCNCGPSGEPLACGYVDGHMGPHAWASLPTFSACTIEGCDCPLHDEPTGAGRRY